MGDQRRLKRCSTSTTTDVEADGDYETQKKQKKSDLNKVEADGDYETHKQQKKQKKSDLNKVEADGDYETQKQEKKQKKSDFNKEMKKLRKSFEEMTKTMKGIQETLHEISGKNENPKKMAEPMENDFCNFAGEDEWKNNESTLLVRGFDTRLPRHDIERALRKHFSSCGEVRRVYVPIGCKTRVSTGFAFVDMKKEKNRRKAIELMSGSFLGNFQLIVMLAKHTMEYIGYENFDGCQRCAANLRRGRKKLVDEERRLQALAISSSRKPDFLIKD